MAEGLGWRDVNESDEAPLMRFGRIGELWRSTSTSDRRHGVLDVWGKFITSSIMTGLKHTFADGNILVGSRKAEGGVVSDEYLS